MKKNLFVFTGLCIIATGLATAATAQKRIAVMGSSTAAGYFPPASGYPKDSAWVWKVKKFYKDLGIVDTVFNIAESSTDCYNGMPTSYTPPSGRHLPDPNLNITRAVNLLPKPDVIIVNYPSNSYDVLPMSEIMFCLQTIKDSANAKGIECYITTSQPRDGFSPTERVFLSVIKDSVINRFGAFAIDFYSDIVNLDDYKIKDEYSAGDGVHLNPAGHTLLKDRVLEKNIFFNLVPLKFGYVNVTAKKEMNEITWETYNETHVAGFYIENGSDGLSFTRVGRMNASQSNGSIHRYTFAHQQPTGGKNYYRLVAYSTTGETTYSNTVSILNKKQDRLPAQITFDNRNVKIVFNEPLIQPASMKLIAPDGKQILKNEKITRNITEYSINISDLQKGIYILQVIANGKKQASAVVKF